MPKPDSLRAPKRLPWLDDDDTISTAVGKKLTIRVKGYCRHSTECLGAYTPYHAPFNKIPNANNTIGIPSSYDWKSRVSIK
jgi:hypothetical protein